MTPDPYIQYYIGGAIAFATIVMVACLWAFIDRLRTEWAHAEMTRRSQLGMQEARAEIHRQAMTGVSSDPAMGPRGRAYAGLALIQGLNNDPSTARLSAPSVLDRIEALEGRVAVLEKAQP